MKKNIILTVSTLAVLLLMFVGYDALVGGSSADRRSSDDTTSSIPTQTAVDPDKQIDAGGIKIDPGQKMAYINYDPITGEPTDYFRVDTWEKVPGTTDEILVTSPELMMRLPTGMTLTITAQRGQLKAESASKKRVQPKYGWLEGDARLVIDRGTLQGRPPLSERPEDRLTIAMDRLEFNLESGELKTTGALRIAADEFEINAVGLQMVWNQDDNRVEKLLIDSGGEMILKGALMSQLGGGDGRPRVEQAPPPDLSKPRPPQVADVDRRKASYRCVLDGGVSVEHWVGDQVNAAVTGEELTLLFDLGRGAGSKVEMERRAPASAPVDDEGEQAPPQRVIVKWAGRLSMLPQLDERQPDKARRRVTIVGNPATVRLARGAVECGRLELHEDQQRLWLYPPENGAVKLTSGEKLAVEATNMFVDMDGRIIKLLGDVRFRSVTGATPLSIDCDMWAELHLAARGANAPGADMFDNPLASSAPESAVFVGNVEVDVQEQRLRSHRLEAYFRSPEPTDETPVVTQPVADSGVDDADQPAPNELMLERAVASGDVHLVVSERSRDGGWRRTIMQNVNVLERSLAKVMTSDSRRRFAAAAGRSERSLQCASLLMRFEPREGGVRISEIQGDGAVALRDQRRGFAASGRRIHATFNEQNELHLAEVAGRDARPAFVRASGYALRGAEIAVDNQLRTLHVPGRSRLAFKSRTGLQGLANLKDEVVTVISHESMHIDELRDSVVFLGEVVAGTSDEQLAADALKLTLTDIAEDDSLSLGEAVTHAYGLLRGKLTENLGPTRERGSFVDIARPRSGGRKELSRVLAHNATVRSIAGLAADGRPLVDRSMTSPDLDIDVRQRIIRTVGYTVMGMTTRAAAGTRPARAASLDMMSGLVSDGPSVTALGCDSGVVYALGGEDAARRDTVLFRDNVHFQRVAVKNASDLDSVLKRIYENGGPLQSIDGQHTIVECDRMELTLDASDPATAMVGGPSMRPTLLNAVGNAYLRDQEQANIRTVQAHQLEYDANAKLIRVLGDPAQGIVARVYDENPLTGRLNMPAQGPEFIIHLDTRTIEAKQLRGRAGG